MAQVTAEFYSSNEYFTGLGHGNLTTWVKDLYSKIMVRTPDAAGVSYWVAQAQARGRFWVAYSFFQSSDSRHTRVKDLYELLLGRKPDQSGWDYWVVWSSRSNATPTRVRAPTGFTDISAREVTASGEIIGSGTDAQGIRQLLVWSSVSDTSPTVITGPDGYTDVTVLGANTFGVLFGYATHGYDEVALVYFP